MRRKGQELFENLIKCQFIELRGKILGNTSCPTGSPLAILSFMKFGKRPERFACSAASLLALGLASPCLAMPPIGYVGPAPRAAPVSQAFTKGVETVSSMPDMPQAGLIMPIGYVGPVPSAPAKSPALAAKPLPAPPVAPSVLAPPVPAVPSPVLAESSGDGNETLITAEQMSSDSETGIVTAKGKAEVVHAGYVLHADKITFNQKTNVLTADGHVVLQLPGGEIEFADHQEITGDMKQAFARNIGVLFTDNSRMAARYLQRYDERYVVADKGMYTACNVCASNPDNEPLWQLKAETITHDNVEHNVYYHNATVDFAGVPILYTPYMSGPDPTVKRRQGFLSLVPGTTPALGAFARIPYYFDIAPDKDATIAPTFSQTDKMQLAVQYRERFDRGNLFFDGSVTHADLVDDRGSDKGKQWRGHVFGKFLYDIDNIWRAGTDIQYASDKSYMTRYDISQTDQTTSRAYIEGFNGRNYTSLRSYYFQDLRAGSYVAEPVVLPSVNFSAFGNPGQTWGGRWSLNANTLVTQRNNQGKTLAEQGPNTRRLSLNLGWERQFISNTGLEATVSGLLRTDSYWADNVVRPERGIVYDKSMFTRQFEQANVVMRYPLGRSGTGYQHLLEPIVAATLAPDVRRISKQPNEDSLNVEFDETNLFSPNRYPGSDLIEGGSRLTYGIRNAITADNGARIDIFGGQSYSFTANGDFSSKSGLRGHKSDYVGRIDFSPVSWFNANYGFRLSTVDFAPQRQDALVAAGVPIFNPSVRYIQAYSEDTPVRQITLALSSAFTKYWAISGSVVHAFDPQPGTRSTGVALSYLDECFAFGVKMSQDFTSRPDISSGTSIAFHFYLKNLGGLHTDSISGINFPAEFRQTDP